MRWARGTSSPTSAHVASRSGSAEDRAPSRTPARTSGEHGDMTREPHQPSERTLRRRKLNERLRRAFIEGAEEQSQRDRGRRSRPTSSAGSWPSTRETSLNEVKGEGW